MSDQLTTMQQDLILPPLPLNEWARTKDTLHRFVQIVGKIRLALMPYKNHWWNVTLYVNPRGIGTSPMPYANKLLDINFDFCAHKLIINTSHSEVQTISLFDGLCVSEFYTQVLDALSRLNIEVHILAKPYKIEPQIPFAEDSVNCTYQSDYVHRFWQILCFADTVFKEFSGRFIGKTSPVHLFWHSFDLATTRFSGKTAPLWDGASTVDAEGYSHEVISAGFWAGDDYVKEPAFYSYTYPSPKDLDKEPLLPKGKAKWIDMRGSPEALLPYASLLSEPNPRAQVLQFLESSFDAGARLSGWDMKSLSASHPK